MPFDITGLPELILSFLPRVLIAIGGGFYVWARRNLYFVLIGKRKIVAFFSRKKYILIWNDDSIEVSDRIINQIKKKKFKDKFRFKSIASPELILYYPSSPKQVHAIILIVTDVTKLDENQKKRIEIEDKLIDYVTHGGTLIGTHDLIYRRCRNEKLQKAFGCTIKKFAAAPKGTPVRKNEAHTNHPLLRDLRTTFTTHDNEITTGTWDNNVLQLLFTEDEIVFGDSKCIVPMLCVNTSSYNGTLIWISSGDKTDEVCDSIKLPQPHFIQILVNAIRSTRDIRSYSRKNATVGA